MESRRNSSGTSSQDLIRCSSATKSKVYWARKFHRKNSIYVDVQRHFLWNKRQWTRMSGKTCPEPTDLRWIGCLTGSTWTTYPNQTCWHQNKQLADMLTWGNFTRDEWDHLLRLFNIMNFSMFSCSHFLSIERQTPCRRELRKEIACGEEIKASKLGIKKLERETIPPIGFGRHTARGIKD